MNKQDEAGPNGVWGNRTGFVALPLLFLGATRRGASPKVVALTLTAALCLTLAVLVLTSPAGAASDRLPDLRMVHPFDLRIERTPEGKRLLRFSSVIVNEGDGTFEAYGWRRSTNSRDMHYVYQRIYDDVGGSRRRYVNATMVFGGDGHNHWHVKDLELFTLAPLDTSATVRTHQKFGYCFYDNWEHWADYPSRYTGCGRSTDLRVTMGLSVGWGDIYRYTLPDQYIDITGLPSGRYRLKGVADPRNRFLEASKTNNNTWIDIRIEDDTVSVESHGPSA